jgi:hemoglobin-like flavoprotein
MSLNVALLRRSFEIVAEREPNVTHRFYDNLFEKYPQAKPLFGKNARQNQEQMLLSALVSLVDHLDDAPWLEETLGAIGAKHLDYGVADDMYPWVGDALVTTFAQVAGADWTEEMAAEWGKAYAAITELALKGARKARDASSAA